MCGRFTTTETQPEVIQQAFDLPQAPHDPKLRARYNIAPTQEIPVIAHDAEGQNALGWMQWGLIPHWAKDRSFQQKLINARSETIHQKNSFRTPFQRRRCLVVADGFYEWRKNEDGSKTPIYIQLKEHTLFGFAGLWDRWTDPETGEVLTTCTIITTQPNELVRPIHNRMPVILPKQAYSMWLSRETEDTDALRDLLRPYSAEEMSAYPISRKVNNPANDSPDLLQPVQ